eukprot:17348-Heterococcus_DN1.PRE.7
MLQGLYEVLGYMLLQYAWTRPVASRSNAYLRRDHKRPLPKLNLGEIYSHDKGEQHSDLLSITFVQQSSSARTALRLLGFQTAVQKTWGPKVEGEPVLLLRVHANT